MTKLLVQPKDLNHLKYLCDKDVSGFIIGIKNYAIFQSLKLETKDIKKIDLKDKELYVSMNKPIYNNELKEVEKVLKELSKIKINGLIFEDIAIFNINKRLNLGLNLIWGQMHLPTNYSTCNYWLSKGVKGAFLSTELMLSDFINIKKNTNMNIMVYIYGHLPIFESSRTLISNYLTHIKKPKKDNYYLLHEKEKDKFYLIYEEYNNTFILDDVLNGINEMKEIVKSDINYVVLNSLYIETKEFNKDLDNFISCINGKYIKKENTYTGFLHKESIFKVKE